MTKSYSVGLQDQVVSVYDKTKTTIFGRASQRVINSNQVIGPALSKFIDVVTDTLAGGAVVPTMITITPSGRMFVLTNFATTASLLLYNFNFVTGVGSYVGRVLIALPNSPSTSHAYNGLSVDDVTLAGNVKVYIATVGSTVVNGGLFVAQNIPLTDFVPIGFQTIGMSIATGSKGVYMLQDPTAQGQAHVMTAAKAIVLPLSSTDVAINRKCYVHNGVAATHSYYLFDTTIAPVLVQKIASSPTAAASSTITVNAHGLGVNDQVVFVSGQPSNFLVSTATAHNVYFVRNPTANTFELSLTIGGASILAGSIASPTLVRAFGQCTNMFSSKTGLLPALSGTLLSADHESYAVPGHTSNSGSDCVALATTAFLYLGKLSELTAGVTTWPSLVASNITGTGLDIIAPAIAGATFVSGCDSFVYLTQTSNFVNKQVVNSVIRAEFGQVSNEYNETLMRPAPLFGAFAIPQIHSQNGWFFFFSTVIGQRGIYAMDMRSDSFYDFSYAVTKVLETPESMMSSLTTIEELFDYTNGIKVQYRTASTLADPLFSTASNGWINIAIGADLSLVSLENFTQFKILYSIAVYGSNASPSQLRDLIFGIVSKYESSDYWEYSTGSSSTLTPTRVGFNLKRAYATPVPALYFRAYDKTTGNLVANHNTAANPGLFEYSNNNGASWTALGTISNTVNTLVRYNFATPPGTDIRVTIREA